MGAPSDKPGASAASGSPAEPEALVASDGSAEEWSEGEANSVAAGALEPTAAAIEPSDPSGWIGRVLDERYRVVRLLGEGGMGAVFVAEHLTLHKKVALKVVRAALAGNGEVAARFAREAMATAQFEHPHVASAIDYGTLPEGGAYFVMQLVRGRSLRSLLAREQKLPWRRACELTAQVADALSAAKGVGIIHRDLKPDNILVERREDGSDLVKVLDFGIAHIVPRDASGLPGGLPNRELTRVGTVMGTPGYMSPEQAVGDRVDHRSDLYALGVVLWEAITGRELWQGPDLTSVVTRQMSEPVPRLRDASGDTTIPAELDDLVQKLTARAASDRPEHAAEVRDALRRLAHAPALPLPAARAMAALQSLRDSSVGPWVRHSIERYNAQPKHARRLQAGAVLLAGVSLFFAAMPGDDSAQPKPGSDATAPVSTGQPKELSGQQPTATAQAPGSAAAPAPQPTVIDKVVKAASEAVRGVAEKAKPAAPAYPPELAADVQVMLEGASARERRSAADKVFNYRPPESVAPHLRVIAELESARGCKTRKEAIAKMRAQPDTRYLRSLQRLASTPRNGCGFLNLADCYKCIRADLSSAIDAISADLPSATH